MTLRSRVEVWAWSAAAAGFFAAAGQASATNIVPNGGFELGNTEFSSDYRYVHGGLPEGGYDIGSDPRSNNGQWTMFPPHSGAAMMLINGATVAGVSVWGTAPLVVEQDTQYYFSAWIASNYPQDPAILQFSANGASLGSPLHASSTTGVFQGFYSTWFSGSATAVTLSLVNLNTAQAGNDFSLDDISFDTVAPAGETAVGGTDGDPVALPEPTSILLLGAGALAAIKARRYRTRSSGTAKADNAKPASGEPQEDERSYR